MIHIFSRLDILILSVALLLSLGLSFLIKRLKRSANPLIGPLRFVRDGLIPTVVVLAFCYLVFDVPVDSHSLKIIETLLGIELIWILLSLIKVIFFHHSATAQLRESIPGLFVDLVRLALVAVGSFLVIAAVWQRDLTNFIATLGIGSIVIGLALQDTLGNLFSGIALLFEKPFALGDWVQFGDTIGEVIGTNWRAVRVRTRDLDMVVVPNTSLTKEKIKNFTRPTRVHREILKIGFSYGDSPQRVQAAMMEVLDNTPQVLKEPSARIRTIGYLDFAVEYELVFFVEGYRAINDICSDIMTRIWYAAKRHGLTIPFPIRTIYKTEVPAIEKPDELPALAELLKGISLLSDLSRGDLEWLSQHARTELYSEGELVVAEGDSSATLYVIKRGEAVVCVGKSARSISEVARLRTGEFFGERSFLTGEPRAASVFAAGELELLTLTSDLLIELVKKRPEIGEQMSELVAKRDAELKAASHRISQGVSRAPRELKRGEPLLNRLKSILGL